MRTEETPSVKAKEIIDHAEDAGVSYEERAWIT
jgi:hypothetical protein